MHRHLSSTAIALFVSSVCAPALAEEIPVQPGESIQDALEQAMPGDVVVVAAGEYEEALETVRAGEDGEPITLRGDGEVVIRASGRILDVQHPHFAVENLVLDGDYGDRDAVRVGDDGDALQMSDTEVRRSGRDCVDMGSVDGVRFERVLIHHCLNWDGERVDAHGITGASVTNLTIVDTEIHTFTGDAIQFDPGRTAPGWTDVVVRRCTFWLEPLAEDTNGVPAGTVPGENAIDTKTNDDAAQANLTIESTDAFGFREGLIGNMAAFNIKENVRAHFDGVRVWDSEIAFRLRGATGSRPNGANVSIHNALVYDVDVAMRYEDDLQQPIAMYNATFGVDVEEAFRNASAPDDVLDVRNLLSVGRPVPDEATGSGNAEAAVEDFVDVDAARYEPTADAPFIDTGESLDVVETDIRGVQRPFGDGYDPGAYEYTDEPVPTDPDAGGQSGRDTGTAPDSDGGPGSGADGGADVAPSNDSAGTGTDGCGCSNATPRSVWWATLLFLFALGRRRREIVGDSAINDEA